jgi:D-aminopeptidase
MTRKRARELEIAPGVLSPGKWNAITDVAGVKVGHVTFDGSGDYVIAFSTAEDVRRTVERRNQVWTYPEVPNDWMSPLFQSAIEATEEAIYNSLCMAQTMTGYQGRTVEALPLDRVAEFIAAQK